MAKNYSHGKVTKKSLIAALCAVTVTCTGLAAACAPNDENENPPATSSKEDSSVLKNGSFEYFDVPKDAVYLIKNVKNWTLNGGSSVKSGIIGTSKKDWDALSDENLASDLEYNYDLGTSHDDYVDYNSMRARDILYKDSYSALLDDDDVADSLIQNQGYEAYFGIVNGKFGDTDVYKNEDDGEYYFDQEFTKPVRKAVIDNPETHLGAFKEENGKTYFGDTEVTLDDDGNYVDKDGNGVGNVLMVHNYSTDGKYNGLQQSYTSTAITLEANTAAEISLWVKTSDLRFDKGYSALNEQDKGAFIEVVQTVNNASVDSFIVKNINTQKILNNYEADGATVSESNGWLNYKIFVNACDFASSTIQLRLGLGRDGYEACTGYAFFDDVTVQKFRSIDDSSYSDYEVQIQADNTACTLVSETDDKIFNADKEIRNPHNTNEDFNHSYHFVYSVDLASETPSVDGYQTVTFGSNVSAALTTEEADDKTYASATSNGAKSHNIVVTDTDANYSIVRNTKEKITADDFLGILNLTETFTAGMFGSIDYSTLLNDALVGGDNNISVLPNGDNGNMIVMLSSRGAAYTSTIADNSFSVEADGRMVVSFWVKTIDMNGKTAATVKLYGFDGDEPDYDNAQTIAVDSTGVTTNFENEKDIYNGWVPCYYFIHNDTDETKTFAIDFSFGNTSIVGATSFDGGWAAMGNMRTLDIDEKVFDLATSGTYTALFTFTDEETEDSGNPFDEAAGTSDIKTGIANPTAYRGLNGANSSLTGGASNLSYDAYNTNKNAGLISKDYAENYSNWSNIATSFLSANAAWNDVFGNDCYQPLIIINSLRTYADKAELTEESFNAAVASGITYYVEDANGSVTANNGKTYSVATEYDENTEYYTVKEVANYGFASETRTVSANSYATVSVKVLVSGEAEANIYLVDADNPKNILSYATPAFTFYYDEEGNVLDEELDEDWKETEHREHIVYTLRNDGLYEDKDGKVYANLHNLKTSYRNFNFEHNTFYDENGNPVSFDNLVNGEIYYSDAEHTKVADHYLINSDGARLFAFEDGKYYYLENGKKTTEVENFDEDYARPNYAHDEKCYATVTNTNGEWKTVNFYLHTGSEAKRYRIELWSGERGQSGEFVNGAIAFDYSAYNVTSDNYSNVISEYERSVIDAYRQLLADKNQLGVITSNNENVAFYEEAVAKLVESGEITQSEFDAIKNTYNAKYYTYTLYDSVSYLPFNENTAEDGETGYSYKVTDFGETLSFFTYEDGTQNSYNVFADFSAVDQDIQMETAEGGDEDEDDTTENTANGDVWLYVSSIILVVVLLIVLVSLLLRDALKKKRITKGGKNRSKNAYRQRDRYIRKLHLVKNEEEASAQEAGAQPEVGQPEEVPVEQPEVEQSTIEETPVEQPEETPIEETEENTDGKDE